MKRAGFFFLCNYWITRCVYIKLAWMHLFLIKAFCALETRAFMCGVNLFANNFMMIFTTLLMRLIGLNSDSDAASCVLGSRTMLAVLIRLSFDVWKLKKLTMACVKSSFIIDQHYL